MPLLKAQEVAEILSTSVAGVYQLARDELLPHVRLGRRIRVDPEVLAEWIRNGGQALPGGWRQKPPVDIVEEDKEIHDVTP